MMQTKIAHYYNAPTEKQRLFVDKNGQLFKSMFREYDIRGRVNEDELNAQSVNLIVSAYAQFLRRRNITKAVVGYDNRDCSEEFAQAAIEALLNHGIDVVFVGLSLSPAVYFAQYHYQCEGAVMITASHNPNGWSGFKFANGYSVTLMPEDIKEVYQLVVNGDAAVPEPKRGTLKVENVREAYIDAIASRIKMGPNVPKVVIDAGNGGAGVFAYELFHRLGCLTFQLNCDPDTDYPHYFPNPSNQVERDRLRAIVTHPYINADIGIGFDGDGDRVGVIDEKGNDIWSDAVLAVLAKQLLEKYPSSTIVFDVKCSQMLEETIEDNGGVPLMWKTGHSYIKAKMQEVGAELAGERSGHLFFGKKEYFGYDDGLFAGAKLVEYLSNINLSLSEILDTFPKYITSPEIKTHCKDEEKYQVVAEITRVLEENFPGQVNTINGARVTFEHGWGLVRASSNLPELVMVFEADTFEHLLEIREIFKTHMAQFPEIDPNWENDIKQ